MAYPDFPASRAFAITDHEVAHVYIRNPSDIPLVRDLLSDQPGIASVLAREDIDAAGLYNARSGELVLIAGDEAWFAYPWWHSRDEAPDYAGHVDIHNKPGYDPCELFLGWPPGTVSQNTDRIRGSHGRVGTGREIAWSATFPLSREPASLIELATMTRNWLKGESA